MKDLKVKALQSVPLKLPADITQGDKPGERVKISESYRNKADAIYPELLNQLIPVLKNSTASKAVVAVCGGSGVGKTVTASVLACYLNAAGIGCYILSGDNYPRRIPSENDAERQRIFRESALKGMIADGEYTKERFELIHGFQMEQRDADSENQNLYPWYASYLKNGEKGLAKYLGSKEEIDFEEVEKIVREFKSAKEEIWLKRMGRESIEIWYEKKDFRNIRVLLIEWTHGNSDQYKGVDISILLNSTPEETLFYRMQRKRDIAVDSPFTALVLKLEQKMLKDQAKKAGMIVTQDARLISYADYIKMMKEGEGAVDSGPMLNAYPDSMGGTLSDIVDLLQQPELKNIFTSFYILPSLFHTDLDRGFSVIDYSLNETFAKEEDLERIKNLEIKLKLDFILNHASVRSNQFQDILKNGETSIYKDFFINWNKFWEGHGEMTEDGYLMPEKEMLSGMFFRKEGLPLLMVRFPDGKEVPYWNTFYQEVHDRGDGEKEYLGQMDLNIKSPLVWEFYENTLKMLAGYGAGIVRLDAFAYAPKEPGAKNFLNEPETWELLKKIRKLSDPLHLTLLPEIHAAYEEKIYERIAAEGYLTYDFFLPGLILDALEEGSGETLAAWAKEQKEKGIHTVNMLGCHDGIPVLDLKGMIPEERIRKLIETIVSRGGFVKDLHGRKNVYYQVNASYYSALGEDDKRLLAARALQLFMPGKPQIWYLDLFAGKNDYEAVKRAGAGGHKEINRTNLSKVEMCRGMKTDVVRSQLKMLRFRFESAAFGFEAELSVKSRGNRMDFIWENNGARALLSLDLLTCSFEIRGMDKAGNEEFCMLQNS